MKNLKGCMLHNTDDWKTPSNIYKAFIDKGFVDCFPYQSNVNQLATNYFYSKLFINPPYSKMNEVYKWILDQIHQNNKVALLIPARTDTQYFFNLVAGENCDIVFIRGRLKFNDSNKVAPFPSILLLFNYHNIHCNYYIIPNNLLVDFILDVL